MRAKLEAEVGIDRLIRDIRTGRFEQLLSGLTGVGALVTAVEIFFEHDRASFGNKNMYLPVALGRLGPPPPIRFFTPAEQAVGAALFDQLLDQREPPKIPVLEMVDARLAEAITDGWRYEDMPEDGAAFRATFAFLDEDAERS